MTHSKLHQMARLQEILKKWRKLALKKAHSFSDPATGGRRGGSGSSVQTRRSLSLPSESSSCIKRGAEGGSSRGSAAGGRGSSRGSAGRVPPGHLAVYVGEERSRFVIKTWYLSHPLFRALLKKTEEEIGFQHEGPLAIPCPVAFFDHLLRIIDYCKAHHHNVIPSFMHTPSPPPPQGSSPQQAATAVVDDEQLHDELLLQLLQSASTELLDHPHDDDCGGSRPHRHGGSCGTVSCSFYNLSRSASQLPRVVV